MQNFAYQLLIKMLKCQYLEQSNIGLPISQNFEHKIYDNL